MSPPAPDADPRTLASLLDWRLSASPERTAMIAGDRRWNWAELHAEVERSARRLMAAGLGPGDCIGLMVGKRPELVLTFLAAVRIGAIAAPMNFKMSAVALRDQVQTARIRHLLLEEQHAGLAQVLADLIPPERTLLADGPAGSPQDFWAPAAALPLPAALGADQPCYYNFTSGSTGRPKGAITTQAQIVENARSTVEDLGFGPEDTFLCMFSAFAHPHELFHRSLCTGAPFVLLETLSPRVVAEEVERHSIRWMMAVPSFYEMMYDWALSARRPESLRSLRCLEAGGAWLSPEAEQRLRRAFGGAELRPVWGSTETTGVALSCPPPGRPGATGLPLPGYDVRICDEQGRELPRGEVGELVVRGPAVVKGYVGQPEETAALFRAGWYHTQDLARQDEDGYIYFVGRRSEMLKIGGIRVYPVEIEAALNAHPLVRDAVVVRAEERVRGEIARAIVQLEAGAEVEVRELQRWCRERLAPYAVPRLIELWTAIPRLPNGKVDKLQIMQTPFTQAPR